MVLLWGLNPAQAGSSAVMWLLGFEAGGMCSLRQHHPAHRGFCCLLHSTARHDRHRITFLYGDPMCTLTEEQ